MSNPYRPRNSRQTNERRQFPVAPRHGSGAPRPETQPRDWRKAAFPPLDEEFAWLPDDYLAFAS